ncbi:serine/threonine specific protein phosphatase [Toxoplasma gondii]|uniref:Serine/threonine specific protein phosphatase n=2 Tax=Toxoplasma gondii TaxID=5811 RepID=A0A7J6K1H2_TOXGO|nr:serine/threonine specific protein phosphatase [Toxoplasma gondii]
MHAASESNGDRAVGSSPGGPRACGSSLFPSLPPSPLRLACTLSSLILPLISTASVDSSDSPRFSSPSPNSEARERETEDRFQARENRKTGGAALLDVAPRGVPFLEAEREKERSCLTNDRAGCPASYGNTGAEERGLETVGEFPQTHTRISAKTRSGSRLAWRKKHAEKKEKEEKTKEEEEQDKEEKKEKEEKKGREETNCGARLNGHAANTGWFSEQSQPGREGELNGFLDECLSFIRKPREKAPKGDRQEPTGDFFCLQKKTGEPAELGEDQGADSEREDPKRNWNEEKSPCESDRGGTSDDVSCLCLSSFCVDAAAAPARPGAETETGRVTRKKSVDTAEFQFRFPSELVAACPGSVFVSKRVESFSKTAKVEKEPYFLFEEMNSCQNGGPPFSEKDERGERKQRLVGSALKNEKEREEDSTHDCSAYTSLSSFPSLGETPHDDSSSVASSVSSASLSSASVSPPTADPRHSPLCDTCTDTGRRERRTEEKADRRSCEKGLFSACMRSRGQGSPRERSSVRETGESVLASAFAGNAWSAATTGQEATSRHWASPHKRCGETEGEPKRNTKEERNGFSSVSNPRARKSTVPCSRAEVEHERMVKHAVSMLRFLQRLHAKAKSGFHGRTGREEPHEATHSSFPRCSSLSALHSMCSGKNSDRQRVKDSRSPQTWRRSLDRSCYDLSSSRPSSLASSSRGLASSSPRTSSSQGPFGSSEPSALPSPSCGDRMETATAAGQGEQEAAVEKGRRRDKGEDEASRTKTRILKETDENLKRVYSLFERRRGRRTPSAFSFSSHKGDGRCRFHVSTTHCLAEQAAGGSSVERECMRDLTGDREDTDNRCNVRTPGKDTRDVAGTSTARTLRDERGACRGGETPFSVVSRSGENSAEGFRKSVTYPGFQTVPSFSGSRRAPPMDGKPCFECNDICAVTLQLLGHQGGGRRAFNALTESISPQKCCFYGKERKRGAETVSCPEHEPALESRHSDSLLASSSASPSTCPRLVRTYTDGPAWGSSGAHVRSRRTACSVDAAKALAGAPRFSRRDTETAGLIEGDTETVGFIQGDTETVEVTGGKTALDGEREASETNGTRRRGTKATHDEGRVRDTNREAAIDARTETKKTPAASAKTLEEAVEKKKAAVDKAEGDETPTAERARDREERERGENRGVRLYLKSGSKKKAVEADGGVLQEIEGEVGGPPEKGEEDPIHPRSVWEDVGNLRTQAGEERRGREEVADEERERETGGTPGRKKTARETREGGFEANQEGERTRQSSEQDPPSWLRKVAATETKQGREAREEGREGDSDEQGAKETHDARNRRDKEQSRKRRVSEAGYPEMDKTVGAAFLESGEKTNNTSVVASCPSRFEGRLDKWAETGDTDTEQSLLCAAVTPNAKRNLAKEGPLHAPENAVQDRERRAASWNAGACSLPSSSSGRKSQGGGQGDPERETARRDYFFSAHLPVVPGPPPPVSDPPEPPTSASASVRPPHQNPAGDVTCLRAETGKEYPQVLAAPACGERQSAESRSSRRSGEEGADENGKAGTRRRLGDSVPGQGPGGPGERATGSAGVRTPELVVRWTTPGAEVVEVAGAFSIPPWSERIRLPWHPREHCFRLNLLDVFSPILLNAPAAARRDAGSCSRVEPHEETVSEHEKGPASPDWREGAFSPLASLFSGARLWRSTPSREDRDRDPPAASRERETVLASPVREASAPVWVAAASNDGLAILHVQFKFIVDGEWKCSDVFPVKDDGSGNLNNVVALFRSRPCQSSFLGAREDRDLLPPSYNPSRSPACLPPDVWDASYTSASFFSPAVQLSSALSVSSSCFYPNYNEALSRSDSEDAWRRVRQKTQFVFYSYDRGCPCIYDREKEEKEDRYVVEGETVRGAANEVSQVQATTRYHAERLPSNAETPPSSYSTSSASYASSSPVPPSWISSSSCVSTEKELDLGSVTRGLLRGGFNVQLLYKGLSPFFSISSARIGAEVEPGHKPNFLSEQRACTPSYAPSGKAPISTRGHLRGEAADQGKFPSASQVEGSRSGERPDQTGGREEGSREGALEEEEYGEGEWRPMLGRELSTEKLDNDWLCAEGGETESPHVPPSEQNRRPASVARSKEGQEEMDVPEKRSAGSEGGAVPGNRKKTRNAAAGVSPPSHPSSDRRHSPGKRDTPRSPSPSASYASPSLTSSVAAAPSSTASSTSSFSPKASDSSASFCASALSASLFPSSSLHASLASLGAAPSLKAALKSLEANAPNAHAEERTRVSASNSGGGLSSCKSNDDLSASSTRPASASSGGDSVIFRRLSAYERGGFALGSDTQESAFETRRRGTTLPDLTWPACVLGHLHRPEILLELRQLDAERQAPGKAKRRREALKRQREKKETRQEEREGHTRTCSGRPQDSRALQTQVTQKEVGDKRRDEDSRESEEGSQHSGERSEETGERRGSNEEEERDNSEESEELSETTEDESSVGSVEKTRLCLQCGAYMLPHPDKVESGGADAFFIASCPRNTELRDKISALIPKMGNKSLSGSQSSSPFAAPPSRRDTRGLSASATAVCVGVADGVGEWESFGLNPRMFAEELMVGCWRAAVAEPWFCTFGEQSRERTDSDSADSRPTEFVRDFDGETLVETVGETLVETVGETLVETVQGRERGRRGERSTDGRGEGEGGRREEEEELWEQRGFESVSASLLFQEKRIEGTPRPASSSPAYRGGQNTACVNVPPPSQSACDRKGVEVKKQKHPCSLSSQRLLSSSASSSARAATSFTSTSSSASASSASASSASASSASLSLSPSPSVSPSSSDAVSGGRVDEAARKALHILQSGFKETRSFGSSTALVVCLDGLRGRLGVASLGDSAVMVLRRERRQWRMTCAHRSQEQQHQFNCPFQLACLPQPSEYGALVAQGKGMLIRVLRNASVLPQDTPEMAQVYSVHAQEGDLVLLGTDGVFDNLFDHEICALANLALSPYEAEILGDPNKTTSAQAVAAAVAEAAAHKSRNPMAKTPFMKHARRAKTHFMGGKMDDITVVACWVTCGAETGAESGACHHATSGACASY